MHHLKMEIVKGSVFVMQPAAPAVITSRKCEALSEENSKMSTPSQIALARAAQMVSELLRLRKPMSTTGKV